MLVSNGVRRDGSRYCGVGFVSGEFFDFSSTKWFFWVLDPLVLESF